jgi:cyclopropane fatty-acyl-phospholipid synthase-like methyltransferase
MSSANYWKNLSENIKHPVETKNKRPDTSDLEVSFLESYISKDSDILDIGSGSGLIINKLIDKVKHITAVEKFEGFTKFIIDRPNMLVINADLVGFKIRKLFDCVLCFGVAQCFKKNVMLDIYNNLFTMIEPGGLLILRIHCALEEDIIVDGFSEELQTEYFAEYRNKEREIKLLREIGFTEIKVFDIFPDSLNVWKNSRHFIFVCYK